VLKGLFRCHQDRVSIALGDREFPTPFGTSNAPPPFATATFGETAGRTLLPERSSNGNGTRTTRYRIAERLAVGPCVNVLGGVGEKCESIAPLVESTRRDARSCSLQRMLGDVERRSERVSLGVERDDLLCPERVQAVCVTRLIAKLDLESVVGENLDHCADLPGDETQLGQVADESHGVEQMNVGSSRHSEVSIG